RWRRPGENKDNESRIARRRGGRRDTTFRDGYVRVSNTQYLQQTIELDDDSKVEVIQHLNSDPEDAEDAPAEDVLRADWISIVEEDESTPNHGRGAHTVHSKRQARHVSRHHQQLTLANNVPTPAELSRLRQ